MVAGRYVLRHVASNHCVQGASRRSREIKAAEGIKHRELRPERQEQLRAELLVLARSRAQGVLQHPLDVARISPARGRYSASNGQHRAAWARRRNRSIPPGQHANGCVRHAQRERDHFAGYCTLPRRARAETEGVDRREHPARDDRDLDARWDTCPFEPPGQLLLRVIGRCKAAL